jgi:hypothetical protein
VKNYLTHLILRQQGERPAIRPRLLSRFEHAAEVDSSAVPPFFSVDRAATQTSFSAPVNDRFALREPGGILSATVGTRTIEEPQSPAGNDVKAVVEPLPFAQIRATTSGAVPADEEQGSEMASFSEPEMANSTEQAYSTSSTNPASNANRESPLLPQAIVVEPSAQRLSALQARTSRSVKLPEATSPAALQTGVPPRHKQEITTVERPLVHVTIGRIDIRADLNKAAAPKPGGGARASQPQPLADYLKGRGTP